MLNRRVVMKLQQIITTFVISASVLSAHGQDMGAFAPRTINVPAVQAGLTGPWVESSYALQLMLWRQEPNWSQTGWFVADELFPFIRANVSIECVDLFGTRYAHTFTWWRGEPWDLGIALPRPPTCTITGGTITNTTSTTYNNLFIGFASRMGGNFWRGGGATRIDIPGGTECVASINDLNLGTLYARDSKNVQWPYTTTNGKIELTGNDISQSGIMRLGGADIEIRPDNDVYIKYDGNATRWVAPNNTSGSGVIPLSV
ncbi:MULTISPECIES: hypothetical protein [unclassified Pantoea]|uniref:hypothetical protein n=1 Tax=unclassified Pantoea TaxID=2630326 RepID=UPI0023DAE7BF|nr:MULTISPECIES: hypothetical protein [unclassified Pantoea]MDF2040889.1 hypothetical protein [Pantoea sp. Cr_R14]MDF2071296.1 hypothetical protein [Pantoea sp. Cr_R13]MDF2080422.1 hypothetical protein [Pantoea sp. Cr_R21]